MRGFAWPIGLSLVLTLCADSVVMGQDARFRVWDTNGDGKLTLQETPESLRSLFPVVDTNKDNFVTEDEARIYLQAATKSDPTADGKVEVLLDLPYANNTNPRQRLDVVLPQPRATGKLPVLVFLHGGGWRAGDKSSGLNRLKSLAAEGKVAGVTINYRFTNEAQWPAQCHDCKAAIRWIRGNAEKYGFDADKIGVIGYSAGGHLVAMLGATGDSKDAHFEGTLGQYLNQSTRVSCVIDNYGPTDLVTKDPRPADAPDSLLFGGPTHEKVDLARTASPVYFATRDDAPTLMIHGENDRVVPFEHSERLLAALTKAEVPAILVKVEGGSHGGFQNPEIDRRTKLFLEKYLLGTSAEISGEPVPVAAK